MKQLHKSENPAAYAALASEGTLLGYPVKINNQDKREDNGIPYHSSIKFFDKKDHPHAIHHLAQHLILNPPDAKNTQIETGQLKDRLGNDVFVVKLFGNSAEKIKEHHSKFSHMGNPDGYVYEPHISVPKAVHDKIKSSGAKTAHEAGIEFGPAQLRQGPTVLHTYHHKPDQADTEFPDEGDMTAKMKAPVTKSENVLGQKPLMKPYVSDAQRRWAHTPTGKKALGGESGVHEWDEATKGKKLPERVGKSETPLQKGILQTAGTALGMAGALAGATPGANAQTRSPASIEHVKPHAPSYDHNKMLRTLAQVESSGGIKTHHASTPQGTGYGKYALMPNTIHNVIQGHKDLRNRHGKALALTGHQLHRYMQDNPGLEDVIADRYLHHIEHKLGKDPGQNGYAWFEGIARTKRHQKTGVDIKNHWRTKRVEDAYKKAK